MFEHAGDYDTPWDPDLRFIVTDDLFNSFDVRGMCGNQFEVVGRCAHWPGCGGGEWRRGAWRALLRCASACACVFVYLPIYLSCL